MKGVVFTEFVDMVEDSFGLDTVDAMLAPEGLPSGGVYTATGTYGHAEIVTLLTRLTTQTGVPIPDLLRSYGEHLFQRFYQLFPNFFEKPRNSFEFLAAINGTIHVEVRKLYPDAELPEFTHEMTGDDSMLLTYRSPRGLVDLAEGLITGCCRHYDEKMSITRDDRSDGAGTHVVFSLERQLDHQGTI